MARLQNFNEDPKESVSCFFTLLARRLVSTYSFSNPAKDPKKEVTLLDAGLSDRGKWDSWKIQMPSSLAFNIGTTKYNWSYHTTPQAHANDRSFHQPRGKVRRDALDALSEVKPLAVIAEAEGSQ